MTARVNRSESWRSEFIATSGARCHYCNRTGSSACGPDNRAWHVDHMEPLACGGADSEENLVLACKRCNLAKGVQDYHQFAEFARAAFWVPDDWRASEFELDRLMALYASTTDANAKQEVDPEEPEYRRPDGTWHVFSDQYAIGHLNSRGDRINLLAWAGPASGKPIADRDRRDMQMDHRAEEHLRFVAMMRRLLPAMVAEIRMLRESAVNVAP